MIFRNKDRNWVLYRESSLIILTQAPCLQSKKTVFSAGSGKREENCFWGQAQKPGWLWEVLRKTCISKAEKWRKSNMIFRMNFPMPEAYVCLAPPWTFRIRKTGNLIRFPIRPVCMERIWEKERFLWFRSVWWMKLLSSGQAETRWRSSFFKKEWTGKSVGFSRIRPVCGTSRKLYMPLWMADTPTHYFMRCFSLCISLSLAFLPIMFYVKWKKENTSGELFPWSLFFSPFVWPSVPTAATVRQKNPLRLFGSTIRDRMNIIFCTRTTREKKVMWIWFLPFRKSSR